MAGPFTGPANIGVMGELAQVSFTMHMPWSADRFLT
jgi:hypothetical protein